MALEVPESVEYDGIAYSVTSIGPRALAGCDADVVCIPASVASVDEAAFRGSLVASVEVVEGSQSLASYEGVLYDAGFNSLLLIPEGKKGVVRIHSNTSVVPQSAFSHCAGVESIEVDAGNESFCVEDGVLYGAEGGNRAPSTIVAADARGLSRVETVYIYSMDRQGGTGGTSTVYFKPGSGLTDYWLDDACTTPWDKPAFVAERTGYTFGRYFTEKNGGGIRFSWPDGQMPHTATDIPLSPCILYASWSAIGYLISYDAAGGELASGARSSYTVEDAGFDLPMPVRYGYQFDGWDVEGAQGAGVEMVAGADGAKVTRVKAGTYGDLSCTARWTLRYDLDVPVCDPGSVTFEADSMTGQVRVRPGTSAEGELRSYMAVPVALDELACEGLDADGSPDPAGGAPELEAIFGTGSASKVRFTATLGEGDATHTAKVTAGGASSTSSLAGLSIPAAISRDAPGRLAVAYGLELDPDLSIPPLREAAPVARLAYTVSLPGASV